MAVSKLSLSLIFCILFISAIDGASSSPLLSHNNSPAPAPDCTALVLTMMDCLSFVSNGSTLTKPEGTCCSTMKPVLQNAPECICKAFKNSASFGIDLNVTQALALPSACKLSDPSLSTCLSSHQTPAALPPSAPAETISPKSSPPTSSSAPPASNVPISKTKPALAPTPASNAPLLKTKPALAPAPTPDCTTLVLTMIDCLSFISKGNAPTKPEGTCCSAMKPVLQIAPECICKAFQNSASFDIDLNVTRALALPSACKLSDPSLSSCSLTETPETPAAAPATPSAPATETPSPTTPSAPAGSQSPKSSPTSLSPKSSPTSLSPKTAPDCTSLILSMTDCLSFVSNGSTLRKPEGTCCSAMKPVLQTAPDCICKFYQNSASFGVILNVTQALALPSACELSDPTLSSCLSTAATPSSSSNVLITSPAPAPTPIRASASSLFPISTASLLICLLGAIIFGF